ncbi:MAG: NADH-quinone oxidoreductase subunit L [Planctomycetota bacterium]|nr:MAG: NADH-quinone oxidoreductase subunit L [Planctomycetota bacterium]
MNELGPWLILFLPLLSAALIAFGLHRSKALSAGLSIGVVWVGFFIAAGFLVDAFSAAGGGAHGADGHAVAAGSAWSIHHAIDWISVGAHTLQYSVFVDGLSLIMLMVVLGVGGLIHIYALGYMKGDDGFSRFFAYLSLFMFSMLGIVLSDNFFQIFIHWELVGVSSYLLIGYYYKKPSASAAGNKAFLTNRVGDFGFMLGILMLYFATGTANFTEMGEVIGAEGWADVQKFSMLGTAVTNEHFMWVAGALTLMGVMGKSAQFPLHVWLPDAMEGPTPVSALIHAATMVAAGVFLLARIFFVYLPSDTAMSIVAHLGMFTAFFAATIATTQFDIKRILAFSTLSQLGYMVMAIGLNGTDVAMYHLTTHAFFKALLFLGAGSVIHAVHTNDIREMGGLIKKLPITSWLFLIGTLALCGFPWLSGFWSKDGVLHLTHAPPAYADNMLIHWLPTFTAVLTSYYMFRLVFLTFFGKPRYHGEPHESPPTMWVPMAVLCLLAVIAGPMLFTEDVIATFRSLTRPAGSSPFHHIHADANTVIHALLIFGVGAGAAWVTFSRGWVDPERIKKALGPIHRLFDNRWYIDDLYTWIVNNIQQNFARLCDGFDRIVIISGLVNGSAFTTRALGALSARYQTGSVRTYAMLFVAGVAALLALTL